MGKNSDPCLIPYIKTCFLLKNELWKPKFYKIKEQKRSYVYILREYSLKIKDFCSQKIMENKVKIQIYLDKLKAQLKSMR